MTSAGRGALVCAAALAMGPSLAAGCSSSAVCDCVAPGITIHVPADIASSVPPSGPLLSGTACTNATATCENQTNGCTQYHVTPAAAGTCDIRVDSAAGSFRASVAIIFNGGCCSGFYASPASAADQSVPEPASGDAG